jgi:hypothetical protein
MAHELITSFRKSRTNILNIHVLDAIDSSHVNSMSCQLLSSSSLFYSHWTCFELPSIIFVKKKSPCKGIFYQYSSCTCHKGCCSTPFASKHGSLNCMHHKLHGPQFTNISHVKFAFHRFVWNRHGCHSSTYILWTLMSCTLFRHKCHMHICVV